MHQEQLNTRGSQPINQITGSMPIYKARREGSMVVRVLPAIVNGVEQPWVDWAKNDPKSSDGLGDQHREPEVVSIWVNRCGHMLSAISCDDTTGKFAKSPASYACDELTPLFDQAEAAVKSGCEIDPLFKPRQFGPWISEGDMHLMQAYMIMRDGKPVRDKNTGGAQLVAVNLHWSAVKSLRGQLFSSQTWSAEGGGGGGTAADTCLGDYASCAGGHLLIIQPDPKDDKDYEVRCHTPAPITLEQATAAWTPWETLCKSPTHQESVNALRQVLRPDVLGYALANSPYALMLTAEEAQAGKTLRVVKSSPGSAMGQGPITPKGGGMTLPGFDPSSLPGSGGRTPPSSTSQVADRDFQPQPQPQQQLTTQPQPRGGPAPQQPPQQRQVPQQQTAVPNFSAYAQGQAPPTPQHMTPPVGPQSPPGHENQEIPHLGVVEGLPALPGGQDSTSQGAFFDPNAGQRPPISPQAPQGQPLQQQPQSSQAPQAPQAPTPGQLQQTANYGAVAGVPAPLVLNI